MATMPDVLLISSAGTDAERLLIHPPVDTEGGYVWEVKVELAAAGISACGIVDLARPPVGRTTMSESLDLVEFFETAERDWRGWSGVRRWRSLDGRLRLDAEHIGGRVRLTATL